MTPSERQPLHRYRRLSADDDAWRAIPVVWPVGARVSSRPGMRRGTWHAAPEMIGSPRIFPDAGADGRVWRADDDDPRPRVRLDFGATVEATGLLILESGSPGAVLRVAVGAGDDADTVVFETTLARLRAPAAGAVELAFAAPMAVRTVELVCDAAPALDAVGLVVAGAATDDWLGRRQRRERRRSLLLHGSVLLALALLGVLLVARTPADPLPDEALGEQAIVSIESTPAATWATGPVDGAGMPLLAPDGGTWSPAVEHAAHLASAHVEATFATAVKARAVVVVEAAGHGAVRAVDLGLGDGRTMRVHQNPRGEAPPEASLARVFPAEIPLAPPGQALVFQLPTAHEVRAVTVWFETTRVPSRVALDAVGLVPAR